MTDTTVVPDELPADIDVASPRRRRMRFKLSTLPASVTLGNLVCGVLAIMYAADAQAYFAVGDATAAAARISLAGWMIMLGMLCDGFDGRVARLTRSTTTFGGALDSLADLVTFGVAPAIIAKVIMTGALGFDRPRTAFATAAFYAVCACLRLARYNAEHEEAADAVDSFGGLPTPGAAGVIAGLALIHAELLSWWGPDVTETTAAAYFIGFALLTGLGMLMVSRVPYMHVANKLLRGRRGVGGVALIVLALMLFANLDLAWLLCGVFTLYAASGVVLIVPRILRGRREELPELFD